MHGVAYLYSFYVFCVVCAFVVVVVGCIRLIAAVLEFMSLFFGSFINGDYRRCYFAIKLSD